MRAKPGDAGAFPARDGAALATDVRVLLLEDPQDA